VIEPALSDDAFLADVASAGPGVSFFYLWWLGQSGFLLKFKCGTLLIDPYLSDSLTTKYAATDKPHVRMTRRVIDPSRLKGIDVITSSHNHTDHLDGDTLVPLMRANPEVQVVVPEANRDFAAGRLGVDPARLIGLDDGNALAVSGITIWGVPAAHNDLERDDRGRCRYMGYVITGNYGGWSVYHSGDTVPHDAIVDSLRSRGTPIDAALLPINGDRPERRVAGNFNGREAARLAKEIGAKVAIPCHYDMFEFNTADPRDEFIPECERLGQPYKVLRAGERWSMP
jgi:L-ascorbate metabolism protein UlaG (beta-lactamase superfamily)